MVDDQEDKLEKLANEVKDDDTFEKIDELEKELNLDEESKEQESDDEDKPEEKKTAIEKVIEETPAVGLINNNPLDGRQP